MGYIMGGMSWKNDQSSVKKVTYSSSPLNFVCAGLCIALISAAVSGVQMIVESSVKKTKKTKTDWAKNNPNAGGTTTTEKMMTADNKPPTTNQNTANIADTNIGRFGGTKSTMMKTPITFLTDSEAHYNMFMSRKSDRKRKIKTKT